MDSERKSWWKQMGVEMGRAFLNVLFPPMCAVCNAEGEDTLDGVAICRGCQQKLLPNPGDSCPRCASPLKGRREGLSECPFVGTGPTT